MDEAAVGCIVMLVVAAVFALPVVALVWIRQVSRRQAEVGGVVGRLRADLDRLHRMVRELRSAASPVASEAPSAAPAPPAPAPATPYSYRPPA